jgi:hypothetical protein
MPNEIPGFLQDFMNHRKHVTKQDTKSPAVKKSESLKPAVGKLELEMGLEGIIDKKPKNKVVREFFQIRVDELSKTKIN